MVLNSFNHDVYSEYYKRKMIEFFINSPSLKQGKEDLADMGIFEFLYHDSFLEAIQSYINRKEFYPYFTSYQKQGMYALLSEFRRFSNLDVSHTRRDFMNFNIISLNNMQDILSEEELLRLQLKMRAPFYARKNIVVDRNTLYLWSAMDLDFLYQLAEDIPEELFQENLQDFIACDGTLSSIFTYAKECPAIFEDEIALRRMQMLISCNFALRKGKEVPCSYQEEDVTMAKNFRMYLLNKRAGQIVTRRLKKH